MVRTRRKSYCKKIKHPSILVVYMEADPKKKELRNMRLDSAMLILLGSVLKGVASAINDFSRQQPARQRGGSAALTKA
jgi:hypothetical protein